MNKILILLLFLCFGLQGFYVYSKNIKKPEVIYKKMNNWLIGVQSKEVALLGVNKNKKILTISKKEGFILFISAEYQPVAKSKILQLIKEWKGNKKSLRIKKNKDIKIFSFTTKKEVHFFTNRGGYLMASLDSLNKSTYEEVQKRVQIL